MNLSQTTICLVRHGETDWNKSGKIQGTKDIALSAEGEWQAVQVAMRLQAEPGWNRVYSSQLIRAYKTADVIAKTLQIGHHADARLQERSYGVLEGMTHEEIFAKYPGFSFQKDVDLPGLEKLPELRQRMTACLNDIAGWHPGERIVVISHGASLRAFVETLQMGTEPLFFGNTSCTIISRSSSGWRLELLNDVSHLDQNKEKLA